MIEKLRRVPLREVWKHEALDFTKWLQENLDVLNEVAGLSLSNVEREQSAGDFTCDLSAEDESGNTVIIENQLERSNHDHLGKLITYLSALEAKTAIWIVSDPRAEHVGAINWLNESVSSASFYLIKVEAVRIGESPPAPLLTLIVGPGADSKAVLTTKTELVERHKSRHQFWTQLLEYSKQKTKLHANISPSIYNWLGTGAGRQGLSFNYVITKHDVAVELYIDRGKEAEEENKTFFDELHAKKAEIEEVFGAPLDWQRLDEKRACRIKKVIDIGGYADEEKWPQIDDAAVTAMIRLEKALRPFLSRLKE